MEEVLDSGNFAFDFSSVSDFNFEFRSRMHRGGLKGRKKLCLRFNHGKSMSVFMYTWDIRACV